MNTGLNRGSLMAKLPSYELAIIDERKLTAYLLDRAHRFGGPKAVFFESFGYSAENWQVLRDAILAHAGDHEVDQSQPTRHGQVYEVVGPLAAQDGRSPLVRVVWMIRNGEDRPRLVTVVPS